MLVKVIFKWLCIGSLYDGPNKKLYYLKERISNNENNSKLLFLITPN